MGGRSSSSIVRLSLSRGTRYVQIPLPVLLDSAGDSGPIRSGRKDDEVDPGHRRSGDADGNRSRSGTDSAGAAIVHRGIQQARREGACRALGAQGDLRRSKHGRTDRGARSFGIRFWGDLQGEALCPALGNSAKGALHPAGHRLGGRRSGRNSQRRSSSGEQNLFLDHLCAAGWPLADRQRAGERRPGAADRVGSAQGSRMDGGTLGRQIGSSAGRHDLPLVAAPRVFGSLVHDQSWSGQRSRSGDRDHCLGSADKTDPLVDLPVGRVVRRGHLDERWQQLDAKGFANSERWPECIGDASHLARR